MPSSKVKRAKERRDIQVHPGALRLADYMWSLKTWDGELKATQHMKISSQEKAATEQRGCMGRYTLVGHIVMEDRLPVYKRDGEDKYLYRKNGSWQVGSIVGDTKSCLFQVGSKLLSPSKTPPWQYGVRGCGG